MIFILIYIKYFNLNKRVNQCLVCFVMGYLSLVLKVLGLFFEMLFKLLLDKEILKYFLGVDLFF